jgi:hypothetical protein
VNSCGGGADFACVGGLDNGLWCVIVLDKEAIGRCLKVDDASEDAAFEAAPGEDGEKAFLGIDWLRSERSGRLNNDGLRGML